MYGGYDCLVVDGACEVISVRRPWIDRHVNFDLDPDLASSAGCGQLIKQALAWRGRLDALVNNASSFKRTPLGTVDDDQWSELIDGNLKAAFFCSQFAAPALTASRGAIINVCDARTDRPLPGFSVYIAAKAAIVSLTRALACVGRARARRGDLPRGCPGL